MGLFTSKKKREKEKMERAIAEYEKNKAREESVLREYAMKINEFEKIISEDRILLCGVGASFYLGFMRGALATEKQATMDWDAILEKCDEFQPTMLILTFGKPEQLPEVRTFAKQIGQKHPDIVIAALFSDPDTAPRLDSETDKPIILLLPRGCNRELFFNAITALKQRCEE